VDSTLPTTPPLRLFGLSFWFQELWKYQIHQLFHWHRLLEYSCSSIGSVTVVQAVGPGFESQRISKSQLPPFKINTAASFQNVLFCLLGKWSTHHPSL